MSQRLLWAAILLVAGHLGCEDRHRLADDAPDAAVHAWRSQAAARLPAERSIADVAAQVTPSVVSILSEGPNVLPAQTEPTPGEPPQLRQYSIGSGVIVSSEGLILTSFHVVANAERIGVALNDGRKLRATLIGGDAQSDLAVLRVESRELPAIAVADSSSLRIGDVVLAVGNPFGIGQTVTMGIVSAVGRSNMGITKYDDFIQTDAAINPGSSGGALVDMEGRLVGINTAILSRSGGYQGIGFAIPSRMAVQIKDALVEHGRVIRGWLGAGFQDLSNEVAGWFDLERRAGVLISEISPGSPAARAGMQLGDVITAVDGTRMGDSNQLRNLLALMPKGRRVRIDALRDHEPRTFNITIEEQPAADAGLLGGLDVHDLEPTLRAHLEVPEILQGVVVTSIEPGTPAAVVGLLPGDVILEINGVATPTVEAFREATAGLDDHAVVLIYRGGAAGYVAITR